MFQFRTKFPYVKTKISHEKKSRRKKKSILVTAKPIKTDFNRLASRYEQENREQANLYWQTFTATGFDKKILQISVTKERKRKMSQSSLDFLPIKSIKDIKNQRVNQSMNHPHILTHKLCAKENSSKILISCKQSLKKY